MDIWQQRREFVSEAFHSLNQPLTALHCVIELALLQPRSAEEYRLRLEEALGLADRILELTAGVRELVEAEDPGVQQEVRVGELLEQAAKDFGALADSQVELTLEGDAVMLADSEKLSRIFLRLLEQIWGEGVSAMRISTHAGAQPCEIGVRLEGAEPAEASHRAKPGMDGKLRSMRLAAAVSAIEAESGRLDFTAPNCAVVTLPVVRLMAPSDHRTTTDGYGSSSWSRANRSTTFDRGSSSTMCDP